LLPTAIPECIFQSAFLGNMCNIVLTKAHFNKNTKWAGRKHSHIRSAYQLFYDQRHPAEGGFGLCFAHIWNDRASKNSEGPTQVY